MGNLSTKNCDKDLLLRSSANDLITVKGHGQKELTRKRFFTKFSLFFPMLKNH